MCAQRLWPSVQALGRGLINNRTEIIQQGVKAYNVQNFNSSHLGQGHQQSHVSGHDRLATTQRITHTARGSFNKVVARSLHSGTVLFVKEFSDTENEHAHAILRSLPAYHATTVAGDNVLNNSFYHQHAPHLTDSEWARCSAEEIADGFIAMSQMCRHSPMDLEDSKHSGLCAVLSNRLTHISDNQLLMVLSALSLWPPTSATTTPNFVALWNALDQSCTERMRRWDMARMFLVADHWFALRLSRISMYNVKMTKVLGRRVTSMAPAQLVQYLFYANLSRKLEPFIVKKEIEKRLTQVLQQISVEELGVIAMGFFKTQTFLKSEALIEAIIKKTEDNLECVSDATLCAILKLLRKSIPVMQWKLMYGLLDSLLPQLDRLNNMCLLQVALLGNDLLVFHPKVIDTIAVKFASDIKVLRLKDIERITFALMLYNYVPPSRPDIFMLIAEALRCPERLLEINHYPKCFVSCVVYLMTMGILPQDLISAALQPSMLNLLNMSRHYSAMGREVIELDWALDIEGPANYRGYRLAPDMRIQLTKQYMGNLPSGLEKTLTHQERLLLEVKDKLSAMLGGVHLVTATHILPHIQTPDLVFCTTNDGEPVALPENFLDLPPASLKYPMECFNGIQWNAVIVAGRNSFIRNTDTLRGNVHMKKRQLTRLGYHVSVVPHMEYNRKSLRSKLGCLERSLKEGSTFVTEGRLESAWVTLKGQAERQEEVAG
ncbi:FAST kinase domain-containing protein 5, mitochondrial-like isoform X2 [Homarus americanus]|uniref:FAST kinase domain-containing protein 5-like 2 n=1 Tax=Homarus americanus TaxID=6706 RepID=A0A8J5K159_HOMAM|nr:FAST kinase domain-containing protein 5, mitochondrial-like isoform X2 [Homarus americanus]KAG7167652.1 FAST kinase domain-containing protein 5-like 2 [Homarus americanus]